MKKSLFALAALTAVAGSAQADVTLYGILDLGVAELTHAGNFGPSFVTGAVPTGGPYVKTGSALGMMNGGEKQTRWGIKGSEDLGNGNKAFFQMESAFSLGNGMLATSGLAGAGAPGKPTSMVADTSLNGQLFGRNAFVGLSNVDLGAVTFGRQNSLNLDIITATGGGYDPVNAQMFSPINFSGFYGGGGATDSARVDNSVKYSKNWGSFGVNALYGFGGMAGNQTARSTVQGSLGYETARFGMEVSAQSAKDSTNISSDPLANTVGVQFLNLDSYTVALRYQIIDPLTLKTGYQRINWKAPSSPTLDNAMQQIYGYTINPTSSASNDFVGTKTYNVFWFGGNYQLTSAAKLSAAFYNVTVPSGSFNTQAFTGAAVAAKPQMSGSDRYYSLLADYDLSKRTNLYAGLMHDIKSGLFAGGSIQSYDTYGAGIVHRF